MKRAIVLILMYLITCVNVFSQYGNSYIKATFQSGKYLIAQDMENQRNFLSSIHVGYNVSNRFSVAAKVCYEKLYFEVYHQIQQHPNPFDKIEEDFDIQTIGCGMDFNFAIINGANHKLKVTLSPRIRKFRKKDIEQKLYNGTFLHNPDYYEISGSACGELGIEYSYYFGNNLYTSFNCIASVGGIFVERYRYSGYYSTIGFFPQIGIGYVFKKKE